MKKIFGRMLYPVAMPLALALLVFLSYRYVFAPSPPKEPEIAVQTQQADAEQDNPQLPDVKVEKPEISHFVDGVVKWTVNAKTISYDSETGLTRLVGSKGMFVRDEEHGLVFSAPVTVYDRREKKFVIDGGIEGSLVPEQHEVRAARMGWDEDTGVLVANDVSVRMPEGSLICDEMELKYGDKKVSLRGNVVMEVAMKGVNR